MKSEHDIVVPVLSILAEAEKGRMSTTELRQEVRSAIDLTKADLAPLAGRPDQRIDQIIRNLKSHKSVPGNPFCEGLLEDVHRGFRITSKGRKYLRSY